MDKEQNPGQEPQQSPPPPPEPQVVNDEGQAELKCKNCGAKLNFVPGVEKLKCEACGTENEIETDTSMVEELDFDKYLNEEGEGVDQEQVTVVKCPSCAAETTLAPNLSSDMCAFCGTNIVVQDEIQHKQIKPASMLPFKIEDKQAYQNFKRWIKKLWFAPNDIKKYARIQGRLQGMYLPFWTYDTNTSCKYTGARGEYYYETQTYTDSNGKTQTRTVRKTRWYPASGTVHNTFDDILIVGTTSLPKKYLEKLEPWDLENLVNYDDRFLSGFKTETYHVNLKDGFDDAKNKMVPAIKQTIRSHIGGDTQRIYTMKTQYNDITFKHILLPAWISAYKYKKKVYRIMINARTGEVQGERPWSWIKITLAILGGLAIIGGGIYAYLYYSGGL